MRRLSSIFKPSLRPSFALAFLAFIAAVVAVRWLDAHRHGEFPWVLMVVATPLMGGLYANARYVLATHGVDEAWIDGGELLLRRARQPLRTLLASIADGEAARGGLVTLELAQPCASGARVLFIASRGRHGDVITALRGRVDQARKVRG